MTYIPSAVLTTVVGSGIGVQASLGTAAASTFSMDTSKASTLYLALRSGSTLGGVIIVEGTMDGTNYSPVVLRTTTGTPIIITTGVLTTLAASTIYGYVAEVGPYTAVRMRVTTLLGSALTNLNWEVETTSSPTAVMTIPSGTQPVSGSVTATANIGTLPAGTAYALTTLASTNGANIKSSAANVFEFTFTNTSISTVYLKLYNKATAPTVGTDVPLVTITCAGSACTVINWSSMIGKRFSAGLGIAITAAQAYTDTTAISAGSLVSGTYV